jgi:UDP-N-acetylmuramoylalanine--D-glutamate ligase
LSFKGRPYSGLKVTIMGLGLHGGGLASALFFAKQGAFVTVTDLKDRTYLQPSLTKLKGFSVRFVLGRHEENDFVNSDLIIKNPAVPESSSYLKLAKSKNVPVETDLSIFFKHSSNPVIAVTGSKGKSTTASAIYFCLKKIHPEAKLGGNITVSPLSFLENLSSHNPVVMELSSWQLADLRETGEFKPKIAVLTKIMPDHMNRYSGMEEYIADKKIIFQNQKQDDICIFNLDDGYQQVFFSEPGARKYFFSQYPLEEGKEGAWLDEDNTGRINAGGHKNTIILRDIHLPGLHNRLNLLSAGLALYLYGLKLKDIQKDLYNFPGIEHRLEMCGQRNNLVFYNDSAATIPEATASALKSFSRPIYLITGGTDKSLDFNPLKEVIQIPESIFLLEGTATEKIIQLLNREKIPFKGPFSRLEDAVIYAVSAAGKNGIILFSPGCASFGMFLNEFDRGRQFKEIVKSFA